jgi:diguanylate cyclase (GGDEF)-like protein/PAS domain S-box-containing protein
MKAPRTPIRYLIAFAAVLVGSIAVGTAYLVAEFRERELRDAERELGNTALVVAEQLDRSFQSVELVQRSVLDAVAAEHVATSEDLTRFIGTQDIHRMLADKISGLAHVDAVTVINAQGKLINFSRYWPIPQVNVSDRDYFRALMAAPSMRSFVSQPVHNRGTGTWTFYLARKIVNEQGDFLGMVLGAIELDYFEKMFGAIALGDGSSVSLYRGDGTLLVRYPRLEPAIGHVYQAGLAALGDKTHGTNRYQGKMNGQERLLAVHRLPHFPLYVTAARDIDFALGTWREQTKTLLGAGILAAFIIGFLMILVVQQLRLSHEWSRRRLRTEKQRLDNAISSMPHGLVLFDSEERLVVCNRRYFEMYGLSESELQPGSHYREMIAARARVQGDVLDVDAYCSERRSRMREGHSFETVNELADGRAIRVINHPADDGGWVSIHEDITERRQLERERDRDREFLNRIVANVPTPILVKDARDLRYVLVNKAALDYVGKTADEVIGRSCGAFWPASESGKMESADRRALESGYLALPEYRLQTPGMGERIVTSKRLVIQNSQGEAEYLLVVIDDITDRKRSEMRIAHLAHHDALTGLPNRVLFRERLDEALTRVQGKNKHLALLYLDLDHFKAINDSLGHPVGDELLKCVADRLCTCVGENGIVARLGGDEFAIIQNEAASEDAAADLAMRVLASLGGAYDVANHRLMVEGSVGIALYPQHGRDPDELLKNADLAMYAAKGDGRGKFRVFEPAMDARIKARSALEFDLREAIMVGGFELHFQPIVHFKEGHITGCEALLRWHHRSQGLIPPSEFIPIAEETGLIGPLGEWVLRTACAEAATWPNEMKIAVNVSPVQFGETLVQTVVSALASSQLPAHRLELEITEAVLIHDDSAALEVLHRLRSLGVRIALDDFGTGYSSLSYLQRFPFDKIKIDRSFVRGIAESDYSRDIVRAIVNIAKTRQITTTAEGVETERQRETLRALGCTEMQGYLFSRPVPAEKLASIVQPARPRIARAG